MRCDYFGAGVCRSCTWMGTPYAEQLAAKDARARELLAPGPDVEWLPPIGGPEAGYRTKAKLAVGGTADAPTFGILDDRGLGVDLRRCGITSPVILAALPPIEAFVRRAGLAPYDVAARRGELKHVLVTEGTGGALLVRLVLRSTADLARLRKNLPSLLADLPNARVVTANIHPEHRALVEGDREIPLTEETELPALVGDRELRLLPQSFVQTNTGIASALYREARDWVADLDAPLVWDLYAGAGGFALHLAAPGREVVGIEISEDAVESGRRAAAAAGLGGVEFRAGDATSAPLSRADRPDLLVVNPPRRGLGEALSGWIEASGIPTVLYSSCDPVTLARDLAAMPGYVLRRARVLDMFPQTAHLEVLTLLERHP